MAKPNTQITFYIVIGAVILCVASFYGGMKYQQTKSPQLFRNSMMGNRNQQQNQGINRNGMMGSRQGFRPVNGEILKIDNTSMTVRMNDGTSRIVLLSEKTQYNKTQDGAKTDLSKGVTVAAFGTENSDGSITATMVQINPVMRGQSPTGTPTVQ